MSPQADVSDITISNNIIRHCGAGISLSGTDGGLGNRSKRININNNLFDDINGPVYGDLNVAGPNDGTFLKIGEPEDVIINHNTIFQTGAITWAYDTTNGFVFTNNLINSFISSGGYQGIYGPGLTQGNNTISTCFPDITDLNLHFNKNVFIGGDSSKYSNYLNVSQNYFPVSTSNISFINYANGYIDYHDYGLSNSSIYYNNGSDNKDIGINIAQLDSAINAVRECQLQTNIQKPELESTLNIFPNPAHDIVQVILNSNSGNYVITDMAGKTCLHGGYTNSFEVNVEKLSNGIYMLLTSGKDERKRGLIVVSK